MSNLSAERLLEIARDCKQLDISTELEKIIARKNSNESALMLPLVGEFSSGKTTLINALTDSKSLETATKPTTSTIYQVFFGMDSVGAQVVFEDGSSKDIQDISTLKNDELLNASVVSIFDTSKKIAASTVLVDTPGLSSPEQKHRENLVGFLPQADGILLVTDINQSITKSMTDFVLETEMSNRPVYLILTKCDTKARQEVESVRNYIKQNSKLPIEKIVCVSAKNDEMQEFYDLLSEIDRKKTEIITRVDNQRVKNEAKLLLSRIIELITATNDSKNGSLDKAIMQQEKELSRLINNIKQLIEDVDYDCKNFEGEASRSFSEKVSEKLEAIIAAGGDSQTSRAVSSINSFAIQYVNELKNHIQEKLRVLAMERSGSDLGVELNSLLAANFSSIKTDKLKFNVNLEEIGHENDRLIANITKGVLIAGAVTAVVLTAGAAATEIANSGAAGAAKAIATGVANSVDAAIVGAVATSKDRKIARMAQAAKNAAAVAGEISEEIEDKNSEFGNRLGMKKGLIEGIVSKITDNTGKPQRRRIINDYVSMELLPQFKAELNRVKNGILSIVQTSLNDEAKDTIDQKKAVLQNLKNQSEQQKDEFKKRLETLDSYKKELQAV